MKLISLTVKNFRCYKEETSLKIDNLTTLIGRNDIGKSTLLEALEIFFNNQTVKIEKGDANVYSGSFDVEITCEFTDLPSVLSVDSGAETTLKDEFLLSINETLKIKKVFACNKKTPTAETYVIANHPTEKGVNNLLDLKEKDLQKIIKENGLDSKLKGNPLMRKAIWASIDSLKLQEIDLPVSKAKEDSKRLWEHIDSYFNVV